ncbi:MAG: glycosyltransferase family 2 protein [Candidatus Krumholzibacteria bacterium]|nr:glycosyltransferase family 2 protein [Candidatus Krumholzibacteria bacterium]
MKLSVIIPTMNKVALLEKTLDALSVQDMAPGDEWEIVVVNDGSTDDTGAFLESRQGTGGASLVVVAPPANVGRAKARNLGARAARGTWILFLDDDIVAPPGLLRAHLALLERNPGCGVIGYAVTDPDLVDAPHFHYLDSRGVARLQPGPAPGRYFVTQNASVPRSAFLEVGGFDEEFSTYGFEDMELAFRLEEEAGVGFLALAAPVPHHVHHHTLTQYLDKKIESGRYSLPHLARLHPARIREMNLHYVVDAQGQPGLTFMGHLLRWITGSWVGRGLPGLMAVWPVRANHRPWWPSFYFRMMSLTVLSCFHQGMTETSGQ